MVNDSDTLDSNPYRSPEWSSEPMAADSGLLTKPIYLKGMLSLDEVLRAHRLNRGIVNIVVWCFLLGTNLLGLVAAVLILRDAHTYLDVIVGGGVGVVSGLGCPGLFLVESLTIRWLKHMWQEQRCVFAYREVTITDEMIETKSCQGVATTLWTEYAYYRRRRDTITLHLRRKGLKRRWKQCGTEERQSRFGVNLQKIDVFPRHQFETDDDWERFHWAVRHKLRREL